MTTQKTPLEDSVSQSIAAGEGQTPAGPAGPERRHGRSRLTAGQLPKWTPYAVGAGALVLSAAIMALIGFNVAGWVIIAAIAYVIGMYVVTMIKENRRKATDGLWRNLIIGAFLIALVPLISVMWTVVSNGWQGVTQPGFFASDMQGITGKYDRAVAEGGPILGGIGHALIGTLLITLCATIISVPIGLLASIYLVEYSNDNAFSKIIRFFVDVMTGIPSIVAGLFAAGFMLTVFGLFGATPGSQTIGFSAAIALAVIMIPIVVRSTEEMLRVVPNELREASAALGVRKWRTTMKVVLPTAISGIASGVTLAIARVVGETAPILVTAGFTVATNWNLFKDWMMALPVYIYYQLTTPTAPQAAEPSMIRAWGGALVLIVVVMLLNLMARLVAKWLAPKVTGR